MKTFTLQFLIDDSKPSGGWEHPYELAVAVKYALENRYGFRQLIDVQPVVEKKRLRAFCVVKK